MNPDKVRVMLVDDHQMLRDGLRVLLDGETDITVVAEAGSASGALEKAARLQPDIMVLDLGLPDRSGLELIPDLLEQVPGVRIVVLSMHTGRDFILKAIDAGCHGYVPKSSAHTSLLEAIRVVITGEQYLHPKAASALVDSIRKKRSRFELLETLSERELDVIKFIAMGFTSREIGLRLNISPKTVDTYRQRAMEKLGINQRPELIRFAIQHNLLDDLLSTDNTPPSREAL